MSSRQTSDGGRFGEDKPKLADLSWAPDRKKFSERQIYAECKRWYAEARVSKLKRLVRAGRMRTWLEKGERFYEVVS
jgi:hypothetical protein